MKKLLTILLTLSMLVSIVPAFAVSAAEEAPEITLDGKLDDWAGLHTLSATRDSERYTYYGVMTEDGLYVAVDAYTVGFDAKGDGNWWDSPNLEFFLGTYVNDWNQRWVSLTNKDGGSRKQERVTSSAASYEAVEGGAPNHFVIEAFIAKDQLDAHWINSDGSMRVGMAVDTNNSAGGGYVKPAGTNERNNRTVVSSTGVYTHDEYVKDNGVITATYYRAPGVVEDYRDAYVGYNNMKQFDYATQEGQLRTYILEGTEQVTSVGAGNADWYIYKWTGTMTAKEAGTYTLIARKIDNGFVMKVDGDKVFEYWGAAHWFDGANDRLVSDEGSFTLAADQTVDVEIYFLELDGGDAMEIFATTNPADTNSGKNINEAFTFDLTKETYKIDKNRWSNDAAIRGTGHNGAQCVEENFNFEETIDKFLNGYTKEHTTTVLSFADAITDNDSYLVEYTGWLVPDQSGAYTFGAYNVDNCFYLEIDGKTAYEFWSGYTWNDNSWGNDEEKLTYKHGNTYINSVDLEAGRAYEFTAYFLETDGGQLLDLNCSIDGGDKIPVDSAFTFSTECPHVATEVTGKKDPTASTPGFTGNTVCKDCGKTVTAGTDIPAIGPADIKIDGNLSDWAGTHTLSVIGSGEFEGKKVTFYAFLGEDGLYLAADAYHATFTTTEGDWWRNTNFEFFVNKNGNRDNQCWVSAKDFDPNGTPFRSHEKMVAKMTNEKVGDLYHSTVEVFMAYEDFGFLSTGEDDFLRVGVAWKTIGDKNNNGEAGGGAADEYWVPKLCWPDNADKAHVTENGIFNRNGENLTNTEVVGKKDATETEDGYTGDTVCKDCGLVIAKGETIPATGKPAQTGDNTVYAVVAALAVLSLGAVVVSKKRRIAE